MTGLVEILNAMATRLATAVDGVQHHDVDLDVPEGLEVKTPDQTTVEISGIDKQAVGQFAAEIRRWRKPEPYKGKGVRYAGEQVRRKAGKAGKIGGKK